MPKTPLLPKFKYAKLDILLDQYEGDAEAVMETAKAFYDQFSLDLPKFKSDDPDTVSRVAHKMRSGIQLLGLFYLTEHQQALSQTDPPKDSAKHATALYDGLLLVLSELGDYFESRGMAK